MFNAANGKQTFGSLRFRVLPLLSAALVFGARDAWGQYFAVGQFPTGSKPLSIAQYNALPRSETFVATANTGDNTLSVFRLSFSPETGRYSLSAPPAPLQASYSVQNPYAVTVCDGFLATSSVGTTISWLPFSVDNLGAPSGGVLKTIAVGPQPYSAACPAMGRALVSTAGDNALSLVDLTSGSVVWSMANVPASHALHGIALDGNHRAWVAGTDANVVTLVDLATQRVVTSFPVRQTIGIGIGDDGNVYMASGADNTFTKIDVNTLQVGSPVSIPPGAVDFVPSVVSAGNSVTVYGTASQPPSVVPNIPGAAGLSRGSSLAPTNFGIFVASTDIPFF
jgi:hypothetical protein